jgi:hypothetical protein
MGCVNFGVSRRWHRATGHGIPITIALQVDVQMAGDVTPDSAKVTRSPAMVNVAHVPPVGDGASG